MTAAAGASAPLALLLGCLLAAGGAAAQSAEFRNVTTGGPLRPGIYGRIAVVNPAIAPPVIYPRPVVGAGDTLASGRAQPVYLYVPPGQVRKWKQNCGKWSACQEPVLFVRVDDSPSRWGGWRQLRHQVALQGQP
jgi:hypothetical protein